MITRIITAILITTNHNRETQNTRKHKQRNHDKDARSSTSSANALARTQQRRRWDLASSGRWQVNALDRGASHSGTDQAPDAPFGYLATARSQASTGSNLIAYIADGLRRCTCANSLWHRARGCAQARRLPSRRPSGARGRLAWWRAGRRVVPGRHLAAPPAWALALFPGAASSPQRVPAAQHDRHAWGASRAAFVRWCCGRFGGARPEAPPAPGPNAPRSASPRAQHAAV